MRFSLVNYIATISGVPEPALRLILSILMTYPIAIFYNRRFSGSDSNTKHVYFFVCGLSIGVFNFGIGIYHSLLSVILMFIFIKIFRCSKYLVMITFLVNMAYLLTGYYYTESESYDITWTMPHCVLVLRLIGLAFDLYDGSKPDESLSSSNKKSALRREPSFIELAGFVYFPASFLIGPQFSMRKYLNFVKDNDNNKDKTPTKTEAAIKRLLLGGIYLLAYQIGSTYFTNEYLLTEDFKNSSFIRKHVVLGLWGKFVLYKYLSCWLLTEGAGIMFGLAYNGTKDNVALWDGFSNIKLQVFEGATKFGNYIDSFNVNTNYWVACYIYKRLAFLGNKLISQIGTLVFLALWHGFHTGYYMTFFMEFVIMIMEKDLEDILKKNPSLQSFTHNKFVAPVLYIVLKLYTIIFMGWCMVPFTLLSFSNWWDVYRTLNYSGFILFVPYLFLYSPILKKCIRYYQ